ncbi:MAG: rod shape-determining protein MreC [Eubacterium sp.]|nr:rod shape-determining protein MreC [Eubacterium sp.]MCR4845531.1 rod shape-determining protein MreC [Eubacterium sp.]
MKLERKKDVSPKYLLIVLSVICIALTVISAFFPDAVKPIKEFTGKFMTPLQEGANDVGSWFDDKVQVFGDVKELKKENEALKKELTQYQNDLGKQEAELAELQTLRDLYDLDEMYPDYKKTAARIFSVNSSGWFNEFYINKGLNDDVYEGCNVICDEGLLGIVVESYDDYAKVRAIIDDRANVTAEIGSAGYLCNVEGSLQNMDNGYLLATDIDKNAIVTEGDKVITSSVSDRYLYGITIGYVTSVEQDPNNLTQTARITLTVNFSDIKDVLVILDRKQEVNY